MGLKRQRTRILTSSLTHSVDICLTSVSRQASSYLLLFGLRLQAWQRDRAPTPTEDDFRTICRDRGSFIQVFTPVIVLLVFVFITRRFFLLSAPRVASCTHGVDLEISALVVLRQMEPLQTQPVGNNFQTICRQ